MGSPPPAGSQNVVFRFRSVSSMVMPAARTGSEGTRSTDHTNRGVGYCDKAGGVMLMAVVLKLMAPKMEDTPARCREKMARSTEAPAWARLPARGGYMVHPVPTPAATVEDARSSRKDGGSSSETDVVYAGECYVWGSNYKGD